MLYRHNMVYEYNTIKKSTVVSGDQLGWFRNGSSRPPQRETVRFQLHILHIYGSSEGVGVGDDGEDKGGTESALGRTSVRSGLRRLGV